MMLDVHLIRPNVLRVLIPSAFIGYINSGMVAKADAFFFLCDCAPLFHDASFHPYSVQQRCACSTNIVNTCAHKFSPI